MKKLYTHVVCDGCEWKEKPTRTNIVELGAHCNEKNAEKRGEKLQTGAHFWVS